MNRSTASLTVDIQKIPFRPALPGMLYLNRRVERPRQTAVRYLLVDAENPER